MTSLTWRQLLARQAAPWRQMVVAAVLGTLASLAGVGLLAGSGFIIVRAAQRPGLGAIAGLLAAVEVLAFIRAPLRYGERLVAHDGAFRSLAAWRLWLYDCLEPLAPAGLRRWHSGELLERMIGDVDALLDLYVRTLTPLVALALTATVTLVATGMVLALAALCLAAALVIDVTGQVLIERGSLGDRGREPELAGQSAALISDALAGITETVTFELGPATIDRLTSIESASHKLAARRDRRTIASTLLHALTLAGALIGVTLAAVAAHRAGHLSAPALGAVVLVPIALFEAATGVPLALGSLSRVSAAAERLGQLAATPAPITDPVDPVTIEAGPHQVRFDQVHLRYEPDMPDALDGIELVIEPGAKVAVVGPSGSGKTSLIHALLRFWPLESGTISLGSTVTERATQDGVRAAVGWLGDEVDLFSGTVRENLLIADPAATEADCWRVLGRAKLRDAIEARPEGLDTEVGENARTLSGGERRRLALARVLLTASPTLVLDEPTVGLDNEVAAEVMRDIAAVGPATVLVITHRNQDLAAVDSVIRLESGRIEGETSHSEPVV